jgi:antitoxin MazE
MVTIQQWGNSLVVRIPAALAQQLQLESGTPVEIQPKNGTLVVKPKKPDRLGELLKDGKPSQLHGETDFNPDVGREIVLSGTLHS